MINIKLNKKLILALIALLFTATACSKLKGEFVIKKKFDETYKKIRTNSLEFNSREKIEWAFIPKKNKKKYKLAITLMKKEIVCVDVRTHLDYLDRFKNAIYGTIEKLKEGKYYIVITDVKEKTTIAKLHFSIYKITDSD